MYVLGIESATPVAAVAVVTEEKILAERMVNNRRTHSVNLLPMMRDVLKDAGISKQELSGIAVSAGPGSFTGLRIGVSTARALAQVLELPVAGVPTLEVLAHQLQGISGIICPILNARKAEVYAALYQSNENQLRCIKPAFAASVEKLVEILGAFDAHVTFQGDGVTEYGSALRELLGERARFVPLSTSYPRAAVVAELGLRQLKSGAVGSYTTLLPQYVRLSEAEIKWRERCRAGG